MERVFDSKYDRHTGRVGGIAEIDKQLFFERPVPTVGRQEREVAASHDVFDTALAGRHRSDGPDRNLAVSNAVLKVGLVSAMQTALRLQKWCLAPGTVATAGAVNAVE